MTVNLSHTAKAVYSINNPNKPLGALIVELPTDIGRSYAGYKRGGILEGAEKFRKEVMAAIIWLAGIPVFKWVGDKICEKLLKIPMDIDFSLDDKTIGNCSIKDSVEFLTQKTKESADDFIKQKKLEGNFIDTSELIKKYYKDGQSIFAGKNANNIIKTVKGAKIATSILAFGLNVFALGVALPLINQAMTRKKIKKMNQDKNQQSLNTIKLAEFQNLTKPKEKQQSQEQNAINNSNISYKGIQSILNHPLASFVDAIENSNTFRLIAPDAPMITGRVLTSRNKYEALENGITDISGIFLYNYCADCVQKLIRHYTKNPAISPVISEIISQKDENLIKDAIAKLKTQQKTLSVEELFNKQTAQEIYKAATYGKYGKINRFIKNETLENIDSSVCNYLRKIASDNSDITKENFKKITKQINNKNAAYLAIGLLTAIIGQAYLIPKIAYKVTEKLTGKNQFSGIAKYDEPKKQ